MTETETVNPFDEPFATGGGLWDGKTVTITNSKAVSEALQNYKDDKGNDVIQVALKISGISEDNDKERFESYSVGKKLAPTADGQGFESIDGSPVKFYSNSNIGKFLDALKASGYDRSKLYVNGRQNVGALVGERFIFKGEAKLDKDGNEIKDKKGYVKMAFFPSKYLGSVGKAVGANGDALKVRAQTVVVGLGVTANKADMVRRASEALKGDPDANRILALIVQDSFQATA
jgi:hypothetical protein